MDQSLKVYAITDRNRLTEVLQRDPLGTAYLLADLEDPYFDRTTWLVAGSDSNRAPVSIVMIYRGLKTPALLTFGETEGIALILEKKRLELPNLCLGMIWPGHDQMIEKTYKTLSSHRMNRMGVEKKRFIDAHQTWQVLPLTEEDLPDLFTLMNHYEGNYFEKAMFRQGLYYGIRMDGMLVSSGGVHTYSPTQGVAAIGNIVTHRNYRRQGLALACTAALVKALFRNVDQVALNVETDNTGAIGCYQKLGFELRLTYTEGRFKKKEAP